MRAAGFVIGGVVIVAAATVMLVMSGNEEKLEELRTESASATEFLDDARADAARLETELAGERRRAQRAESDAAKLRTELDSVRQQLAEAAAPAAPDPAAEPSDWHDAVQDYPVFSPEGLGDALGTVDWEVVAESMSNMPSLIAELATHIAEGRPMTELPAETVGSIQRFNGPLVTTALRLSQKGVAGSDVNGAFSNPAFMANALAATLLAMELPLNGRQSEQLGQFATDYSARETQRAGGYGDDAYTVERLVDESRLKHEYFQKVYALLTPEQHAALRPEAVRGRTQLDIFCESLVWAGKAGPLLFTDRADLARKAGDWIVRRGRIPDAVQEQARELVTTWVDDLPDDFLAWEADGLVKAGMLQVEHVTDSAARVLALLRTLDSELDLDNAQRAALRSVPGSIVVYRAEGS